LGRGNPFQEFNNFWGEWLWFIQTKHPLTNVPYLHLEIDRKSISQFTGLTDKNGKKIFEGDLLNGLQYPFYSSESDEHNYFAEVIWFPGNCAFGLYTHKHPTAKVRGISEGNADFIEDFNSDDWEIIGNIHDNPELLEVTDNA
jgi:uncharacterized phage protein (TIGR01671 family)